MNKLNDVMLYVYGWLTAPVEREAEDGNAIVVFALLLLVLLVALVALGILDINKNGPGCDILKPGCKDPFKH